MGLFGIHLPSLSHILGDTVLLPLKLFEKLFYQWYLGMVSFFEKEYVNPPQVQLGVWWDYFRDNAVTFSVFLAGTLLVVGIIFALIFPPMLKRVPRMLKYGCIVLFFIPLIFTGVDQLRLLEHSLATGIVSLYTPTNNSGSVTDLLLVPIVANPIGAIVGMASIVSFGGALLLLFMSYSVIGYLATIALLPFLALAVWFNFAVKMVNWITSALIVSVVGGIPLGLLAIVLGEAVSNNIVLLDNTIGRTMMLSASLLAAIGLQVALFWACLNAVQKVTGSVYGNSRVHVNSGNVKAQMEDQNGGYSTQANYATSFVQARGESVRSSAAPAASEGVRGSSVKSGALVLAKKYPAAAVAVQSVQTANSVRKATSSNTGGSSTVSPRKPGRGGSSRPSPSSKQNSGTIKSSFKRKPPEV
jgi:hypothetical protein